MGFEPKVHEALVALIKTEIGSGVADLIKANLEQAMEPALKQQSEWLKGIAGGLSAPVEKEPPKADPAKCVAEMVFAVAVGKGNPDRAHEWAKKSGYHPEVVKALAATDPTAGGFLVPTQFSTEIITYLRPQSVVRALGPVVIPMPTGTIRIPKVTTGSAATYVGENSNMTKTQPVFGQITLTHKKLAALVPISNDLVRFSSPGATEIVRDDLVRALAQRENQAFLRDDGTGAGPKGMRHWVSGTNLLAATTGTVSLANVTKDLGRCIQALMDANTPFTRAGWIFSPRTYRYLTTVQNTNGAFVFREEMVRGTLWGWPYRVSTQVPNNLTDAGGTTESEVYLADFADCAIGEAESLILDASAEAAYYDGSNVIASFSQDQTVIRAISLHDFAVRRDTSVCVLYGVTWGA